MLTIDARNVNDAWVKAKRLMNGYHIVRPSRKGEVWEAWHPVTTSYARPTERVLFDPVRNANPFFHLMESLWMLAGREDVEWLARFLPRVRDYSDNGTTFHGAYGYRWRHHFIRGTQLLGGGLPTDQLRHAISMLHTNPDDRRAVLQMWDCRVDLDNPNCKDLPCNDLAFFKIRQGKLLMTVCCRSNDIVWGCYGANAVHFSVLLEYMAAMIGVEVGTYYQISDSWHAYTENYFKYGGLDTEGPREDSSKTDPYVTLEAVPFRLVGNPDLFDSDLNWWLRDGCLTRVSDENPFFKDVAEPMLNAHRLYRSNDLTVAIQYLQENCKATDWKRAAVAWLTRIQERRQQETKPNAK